MFYRALNMRTFSFIQNCRNVLFLRFFITSHTHNTQLYAPKFIVYISLCLAHERFDSNIERISRAVWTFSLLFSFSENWSKNCFAYSNSIIICVRVHVMSANERTNRKSENYKHHYKLCFNERKTNTNTVSNSNAINARAFHKFVSWKRKTVVCTNSSASSFFFLGCSRRIFLSSGDQRDRKINGMPHSRQY